MMFAVGAVIRGGDRGRARAKPRPANERGLPDEQALADLANVYLEVQRERWPELVGSAVASSAIEAAEMARQFAEDFIDADWSPSKRRLPGDAPLGAAYLRYSCDRSNPRSLPQQLRNCLIRANQDGVFVPPSCVFADAAVTGTIANRRGYQMAKAAIGSPDSGVGTLYIDEIGRAARDAVEALMLGRLVENSGGRMVGATDGFDSSTPNSKMLLGMCAMQHEWFVDQLRTKVDRGMADAFRLGKNIRPPAFGHRLRMVVDDEGNVRLRHNGKPEVEKIIDDEEAHSVLLAFTMFVIERESPNAIARKFNESGVGGKYTWDATVIVKLLQRETYIGVEYEGMTTKRRDPVTGIAKIMKRPKSEWKRREVPHLQIVDDELWQAAQDRLRQCRRTAAEPGKPGRASLYPKTLLRPLCGYCGKELILGHSGKYPSFCCSNGIHRKHKCRLNGYKSVRIVETILLDWVQTALLTDKSLEHLLAEANEFLKSESSKAPEDERPLKARLCSLRRQQTRLMQAIEQFDDEPVDGLVQRLKKCDAEMADVQAALNAVAAANSPSPPPITPEDLNAVLADLRALLGQDVKKAAPVLADLFGPITITVLPAKKGEKPVWQAKFAADLVPLLAKTAASGEYPTAQTLEYLTLRGWTACKDVAVRLESIPEHVRLAPEVLAMHEAGTSIRQIADACGICWSAARDTLHFAKTGKLPDWVKRPWSGQARARADERKQQPKYTKFKDVVVQLRKTGLSFLQIARQVKEDTGEAISADTCRRVYSYASQEEFRAAALAGHKANFGHPPGLPVEKVKQLERLLKAGLSVAEIAKRVGCCLQTVYNRKKRLSQER